MVSSSCGCRCTMAALSAPAKPAAPQTATRLGTQPPSQLLELALDRRPALPHLLVRERPVGRAEHEPQRQRLLLLANLRPPVFIEQGHALEQFSPTLGHSLLHL